MITKQESEKMKLIIGSRFTKKIQQILINNGLEPYSRGFISNVFNGRYENPAIEKAFLELVEKTKADAEMIIARKNNLMNERLTDAGTTTGE
ncbi:MAG TPA: hypothetical protein VF677_00895 [Flavobacterium sp.]|jgi:hypothetical protein